MRTDRQRGCLFGQAVGDALGAAVEFKPPGSFEPVTGYRAGGPHGLDPGEWTDDTSMALALADSIGEKGWDLNDQAQRYVNWWRRGDYSVNGRCFDIGNTVSSALYQFELAGDALTAASSAPNSSGNGSIMRLAPVPIHFGSDPIDVAALWAFHAASDFREAVLKAVNLGYDAETTGAVCGQFAGAHWGLSGVPEDWIDGLSNRGMIDSALEGILQ